MEPRESLYEPHESLYEPHELSYDLNYVKVQQGREPLDVDFCSISINGNPDNDILQRRLNDVARQREDLQQMEIELRAQVIARSEILEMQKSFDAQMKERNNAAIKMQVFTFYE